MYIYIYIYIGGWGGESASGPNREMFNAARPYLECSGGK